MGRYPPRLFAVGLAGIYEFSCGAVGECLMLSNNELLGLFQRIIHFK